MNTIRIVLISDDRVDGPIVQRTSERVRLAVANEFGVAYAVEVWPHAVYAASVGSWEAKAQIVLADRLPDVVLCDAVLGGTIHDGPRLLRAMCCDRKFAGFVYLWSSADELTLKDVCKEYGLLFSLPGSGWFNNREATKLAEHMHAHYKMHDGFFSVPSPAARCHCALSDAETLLNKMLLLGVPDESQWSLDRAAIKNDVLEYLDRLKLYDAPSQEMTSTILKIDSAASELEKATPGDAIRRTAVLRDAILELLKWYKSLSR